MATDSTARQSKNLHAGTAGHGLFRSITPTNILSFGPTTKTLQLQGLNVLVGPNGAGKSNLLEVFALLRNAAADFRTAIVRGGGAAEWIWKGKPKSAACIEVAFDLPQRPNALRHVLAFRAEQQGFKIEDERIEYERPEKGQPKPYFFYRLQQGRPVINQVGGGARQLTKESVDLDRSILAQRRDPEAYPEITQLAEVYDRIRLYREWTFGRDSVLRQPQKADLRTDRLEEDFSNLGLFLNRLRRQPKAKAAVLAGLRDLYEGLTDFDVSVEGGTVQVFFTEGDFTIPATRLSDGTVRYLCLLAILCDPDPPPFIGIEEPELGLHPDLLPKVADLLVAASKRTQIIVTTHSDILIDALTASPSTVVIVEKHAGQTSMQRLEAKNLASWLDKYRLGQLWTRGELGGHSLVSARIYIEGGGDSKELHARCREGFRKLFERAGFTGKMPRLVACGGRGGTFDDFRTAHQDAAADFVAMLIDSEAPVANGEHPWAHLAVRDQWQRPAGASDDQVLLMTTCMETWIVSDHSALRERFGADFHVQALPALAGLETKLPAVILKALEHASRDCGTGFEKGRRSFEILGMLSPQTVSVLPSFARVVRILDQRL